MTTRSWIRKLFARPVAHPLRKRPHRARLTMEILEDRCLLSYQITDLGSLGCCSYALGINDSGQVVGFSNTASGPSHAFLWDATTGMQDLGTLPGGTGSGAIGINNLGQVVGFSYIPNSNHAFLWDATNGMQDLGTLPGDTFSEARGINNNGQVVGYSYPASGVRHAFLWDAANGMQDLGTLPGEDNSRAFGINDSGQVVGDSYTTPSAPYHAFLWDAATGMHDLGTLPGYSSSLAYGINSSGQVVGWSYIHPYIPNSNHAFLWDATSGMQDLGNLPGYPASQAFGINDSGQVVGWSYIYDPIRDDFIERAFLWQNGTMTDLTSLLPPGSGWTLEFASAIHNAGQIVGSGLHNGQVHAYLLTPDSLAVSAPASAVAGTPFDVTVTALDASGTVETGYTGTVYFTSSDPQAGLPPSTVPARPPQSEAPAPSQPSASEVVALERWFASLHDGDDVWLTAPRLNHQARGDTTLGMADLFGGNDLLFA